MTRRALAIDVEISRSLVVEWIDIAERLPVGRSKSTHRDAVDRAVYMAIKSIRLARLAGILPAKE